MSSPVESGRAVPGREVYTMLRYSNQEVHLSHVSTELLAF